MSSGCPPSETSQDDVLRCIICSGDAVGTVLLKCLHSACRSCTGGEAKASVTCPVCQVTTETPTGKTNLLVSSLAHRSQVLKSVFSCMQCIEKQDATAVAWCYTCQISLCADCQKYQNRLHYTHKVMAVDERANLSELYRLARSCAKHNEELKFACFTCNGGRCSTCAHDCYMSSHDVLPLDGPDARKRLNDSVETATAELSELNSALTPLQAHLNFPNEVLRAKVDSLAILQDYERSTIDSIRSAHENAKESLLKCWNVLAANSLSLQEGVARLRTRVDWMNKYCLLALSSNDISGLLPQIDELLSFLRACLEEARQFKEPTDPSKLDGFNKCLPGILYSITNRWFSGLAEAFCDDFNCCLKDFPTVEGIDYYSWKGEKEQQAILQDTLQTIAKLQAEISAKDQQLAATQNELQKLRDENKKLQEQLERQCSVAEPPKSERSSGTQQFDVPTKPLSFDSTPHGMSNCLCRCWEVAVSPQGRLLRSVVGNGLKEYDASNSPEVATRKSNSDLPIKETSVEASGVDIFSDEIAPVVLNSPRSRNQAISTQCNEAGQKQQQKYHQYSLECPNEENVCQPKMPDSAAVPKDDLCSVIKKERMSLRSSITLRQCSAIVEFMYSKDAIIQSEMESIKVEKTPTDAASLLLDHVEKKGSSKADIFIEALRQRDVGLHSLADELMAKAGRQSYDYVDSVPANDPVKRNLDTSIKQREGQLRTVEQQRAEVKSKMPHLGWDGSAKCSGLVQRLRKVTPRLIKELDRQSVFCIVDELLAARDGLGLITEDHRQEIEAERTDNGKLRKLLRIVGNRGDEAVQALALCLKSDRVLREDLAALLLQPLVVENP